MIDCGVGAAHAEYLKRMDKEREHREEIDITRRDLAAFAALTGMLSFTHYLTAEQAAKDAYIFADAMMEARK